MSEFDEIINEDHFFYRGQLSLDDECKHDLVVLLLQPKKTLLYNRSYGGGVADYENYPNGYSLQVGLRYDIAMAVARENGNATDGSNGTSDRRIAVSQNSIKFSKQDENLDVSVFYFLYNNYKTQQNITLPVGTAI